MFFSDVQRAKTVYVHVLNIYMLVVKLFCITFKSEYMFTEYMYNYGVYCFKNQLIMIITVS